MSLVRREDIFENIKFYTRAFKDSAVKKAIAKIPSALEWVPCSERLPKEDGRYLATIKFWNLNSVEILNYGTPTTPLNGESRKGWYSIESEGDMFVSGVTAWAQLPESYTEVCDD